jgi:CRP/FNR family transcriptional regulator
MKSFPINDFIESSENKKYLTFNQNEILFKEKNPVKGIFCLLEGKIKVTQKNSEGGDTILYNASAPDIFCLYSILNEENYQHSAVALTELKVCFIPKKDFMKIMFENSKFTLNLMKIICSKIKHIEKRMNNINFTLNLN